MKTAWYWLIRTIVRFGFFVLTGGFRVIGKANVPKTGALIIAPNHSSFLDPPAVACAIPREITFMAKEELFRNRIFGGLIRSLGAFPVRRGTSDIEAIRLSQKILESGQALLMFPEGTRNDGQTMLAINRGVELLAKKTGAKILPVGITGTHRKWGKRSRKFFHRVTVSFGVPLDLSEYADNKSSFTGELAKRISELCNEQGYALKTAEAKKQKTTSCEVDAATELPHP